jgi:hypothetical protein
LATSTRFECVRSALRRCLTKFEEVPSPRITSFANATGTFKETIFNFKEVIMDVYVVRDGEGRAIAAAEVVTATVGVSAAEPLLEEGQTVERIQASMADVGAPEEFLQAQSR